MTPDPDQLPFLVVHGAWVWKVLVVTVAIGALLARWRLRVRRARADAGRIGGDGALPVAVAAVRSSPAAPPLGWTGAVVTLAIAGLGAWFALRLAGAYFAEEADDLRISEDDPVDLGSFDATAIAAALPGSRDKALASLHRRLWWHRARDARSMARLLAVAELHQGCRGVARTFFEYERFDEAAEAARRCGDRRLEWDAHLARGDYEGAMALLPAIGEVPVEEHAVAALATGRWHDAAEAADRFARDGRAGATCLADLFRHHAGDPDAAARLRASPPAGPCAQAAAQLEPDGAEPFVLGREPRPDGDVPFLRHADDVDCPVSFASALDAARAGDGAPLATALERCDIAWVADVPSSLLAVLPRVQTGRERLAAVLPWWESDEPPSIDDHPFTLLHRATLRRDMLRLVGADDEAARLQAIIDRHLAVLSHRDRAIALVLWHEL